MLHFPFYKRDLLPVEVLSLLHKIIEAVIGDEVFEIEVPRGLRGEIYSGYGKYV
jgi:hypothetical protein